MSRTRTSFNAAIELVDWGKAFKEVIRRGAELGINEKQQIRFKNEGKFSSGEKNVIFDVEKDIWTVDGVSFTLKLTFRYTFETK
jgi:hypothetical protein